MVTKEGRVQRYAKERFEALGGLVRKLSYEGRSGAPDLLVILPDGIVWFVEIKKDENTKPDPHQLREHERMRKRGANVFVVCSFKQVDTLIADYYSKHIPQQYKELRNETSEVCRKSFRLCERRH